MTLDFEDCISDGPCALVPEPHKEHRHSGLSPRANLCLKPGCFGPEYEVKLSGMLRAIKKLQVSSDYGGVKGPAQVRQSESYSL